MKNPYVMQAVALAAALGAGAVLAQTTPAATDAGATAPAVVTDAGPPPAQDRSSMGAIVLDKTLVQAQRMNAFEQSSARTGIATVGRGVVRTTMQSQREADLAQAREDAAVEFYRRGAGGLVGN